MECVEQLFDVACYKSHASHRDGAGKGYQNPICFLVFFQTTTLSMPHLYSSVRLFIACVLLIKTLLIIPWREWSYVVMLKWKQAFTIFTLISRVNEQPDSMGGPSCSCVNFTGVRTDMGGFKGAIRSVTWVLYSTCCLVRCRFAFDRKRNRGNRITDNGVSSLMQLRLFDVLGEDERVCADVCRFELPPS